MLEERYKLVRSTWYPTLFVLLLWLVKGAEMLAHIDLSSFGVYPRKAMGIVGIFSSPLVHHDSDHLWANSFPLLILGSLIIYFYPIAAKKVVFGIYVLTGIAVWLFARPLYHIGASGLVYGFAFFLFFSGIFRNDIKSLAISFFTIFMYGGIVWGLMPGMIDISWETHLFGALAGGLFAYLFRHVDLPPRPHWFSDDENPQINYRYIYIPKDKPAALPDTQEHQLPPADEKGADQNP